MVSPGIFRILFAGLVVLHHSTPLRLGGWAILVFFVLSGYWISKMWEDKYSKAKQPFLTFIVSRWWRLFPVMACCLVLYFVWAGGMHSYDLSWALRQLPIMGSTWGGMPPLPPQWSLDVEMQFYLAFGALAFVAILAPTYRPPLRRLWITLSAAGVCYSAWYLGNGGSMEAPYLGPWLGLFLVGIAMHRCDWRPSRRLALGLAAVFVAGTCIMILLPETRGGFWFSGSEAASRKANEDNFFLNWPSLWLLAGILLFIPYLALNVRQSSPRWDRELGNWAYPVYMFHWIPRDWYYAHADWSRPAWFNLGLLGLNVTAAFAGGWLIYVLFDRPVDRWRSRWLSARMPVAQLRS